MKVRKAKLEDKEAILEIVDLLYLDIPDFVWNQEAFVEKQIKNNEYFLLERNGESLGVISLRQRRDKMHIETIAVKNGNQSEGVGTKLINFAKRFTKKRGLHTLRAYSFCEYKSVDFYLNQGFTLLPNFGSYNDHKYYRFQIKLD